MDREKVIEGLETIKQFFGYGLPSTAEMFDSYYGILNDAIVMLNEQEDLGTELTNAVELIHKKNERIEKLLKEQDEEHRRLLSWLGKFCRHIDNGDAWLTDEENIAFFKEKMKQQFGWDTD